MRRNAGRRLGPVDRARRCFEQLPTERISLLLGEQRSTPVATHAAADVVNNRHPMA
jgi:hypothetical protein